jgi:hypothetical protein
MLELAFGAGRLSFGYKVKKGGVKKGGMMLLVFGMARMT